MVPLAPKALCQIVTVGRFANRLAMRPSRNRAAQPVLQLPELCSASTAQHRAQIRPFVRRLLGEDQRIRRSALRAPGRVGSHDHDRDSWNFIPLLAKLVTVLGLLFLLTPPAIEVDFIPVIGHLDWLLIGYLCLRLFIWLCPPDLVCERVTRTASGPLTS